MLDTKPRPDGISDVQRRGLDALAVQAMAALERSAAAGRDRFKLALSEALLAGDDANDMMFVAARMIGEHLGVAQVGFGVVDNGGEYATVGQAWNDGRMPMFAGRWRLEDFGQDRVALLRAGRTLAIDDIHVDDRGKRTAAEAPYALAIRSVLTVPLVRENALVAVLFVHHPDARIWRDNEIALVEDCAARLWSAVMRVRSDERLLQSEALLRSVLDASPDCIKSAGLDGRVEFMNVNGMCAMEIDDFGAIAGAEWASLWPPEGREQVAQSVEAAQTGQSTRFEAYCPTAKGTPKWWDVAVAPVLDVDGTPTRIVSVSRDITDRVQNESQLRASEARLGRELERADIAQQAANAAFYEFDPQTGIGTASPNLALLTGYAHQPTITLQWWQSLVHPSDVDEFSVAIEAATLHGRDYAVDYRIRHKGGHWLWVSDRGRIVAAGNDGQHCVIGMVLNIDEQRKTQLALIESEARYRTIFEQVGIGVARVSLDGRFIQVNDRYCTILGRRREVLLGKSWRDITHPDDLAGDVARGEQALAGGDANFAIEKRYIGDDGGEIWVNLTLSLVRDAADVPTFFVAMIEDIGARKQAEAALSNSEATMRTLIDAAPVGLVFADAKGQITHGNARLIEIIGHPLIRSPGIDAYAEYISFHADGRQVEAREYPFARVLTGEAERVELEVLYRRGDGRDVWVRTVAVALRSADGTLIGAVGAMLDIDRETRLTGQLTREVENAVAERQTAVVQLFEAQKLEALGQLTAGIAHDFNNILAAIAGGMDLIERRSEDPKVKYITGHCKDAAFRGATLVKQMLTFARQEVLAPRSAKLARLADEIAPLIKQAIPGNIVSIDFPADLPPVLIDPVLLETALLNLAVNARDAMPGGGTLWLTASVSRPGDRNHPAELRAVEAVAIAVHDNGEGMPPEIVPRVTEPFFTTKAPGKGTGLGLAMVYGFISQSGGAMHIDSRVGEGTTITLYLPVDTAKGEPEPVADVVADTAAPTGVGAVLLVDDHAAVRAVAAEQLRDLGYTITEADGYAAAMTRIEAGEPFDCVVSDVVMPGGDGVALAAAIRSTRPGLPILLMTGRADSNRVAGEQVLHKPFKLIDLATAVADAIDLPVRELATVARIASRCRSRCVADTLEHWSAAKFAGKVPAFAAFDADVCSEPHKLAVVIADASQSPMGLTVESEGKDLEELLGRPMKANAFDGRGADGFGSAEESYRRAVNTRQPVFDYIKMDFGDGGPERFERLILPYSSNGGLVDRLVSIVVVAKDT